MEHREDGPAPHVERATREDEDEQLRRLWRRDLPAADGPGEAAPPGEPRAREVPDFDWWGPW